MAEDSSRVEALLNAARSRTASYSPRELSIDGAGPVASVLIPLYPHDGDLHVVLTKRTELVETNRGQISFPGGRVDPGDADLLATALRESDEEIGLAPEHVEVLGRVDDFSTRNGEVLIACYAGVIRPQHAPYAWRLSRNEVAELLEVPIGHLFDPSNITTAPPRELNGRLWPTETFHYEGHEVFGATARALRHFLDLAFPDGVADA